MTNEELKIIISLEKIHRYVFDKLYVQTYTIGEDKTDKPILIKYKILCKKFPNFRQQCADAYISFSELDGALKRLGRSLNDEEVQILIELKKINFSRYSISDESKKRIKSIRHG